MNPCPCGHHGDPRCHCTDYEVQKYSARTYHKFLKLARTFADMEASPKIHKSHLIKALLCREIEKEQANFKVI